MTPTPPSTTASSASTHSPESQYRVVRKRNRVPLSCAPCRHRKLKCNRSSPCDNCVRRGDVVSCTYAAPAARKKNQHIPGEVKTPDDMQNRIDRLEGLVLSLMTNGSQSAGPAAAAAMISSNTSNDSSRTNQESQGSPMLDDDDDDIASETEQVTKSFGILKVDQNDSKTYYIGESHWAAILHDIAEVKTYWKTHSKEYQEQQQKVAAVTESEGVESGPEMLLGSSKPPPRNEIMSALPSRYLTDILIARYFNTFDPAVHILHAPTFHKQYARHWEDPSKTSIVWVGMLFSLLRLAMLSYHRQSDEPPEFRGKALELSTLYRTQMANCLILADYTKPHNHLIETLIFHLHGEYQRNREADAGIWVLVGMIARMAMRMGYHRDSKLFKDVTPFHGEMRRRVWTFVRQADLLFSFQLSMPPMIRTGDSDTDLPRNVYDDEFSEDSTELPPSRPINESTPVSYMIAKAKLAFGFGRVMEHVNSLQATSYEEVMKIDVGLREIFQSLPEHLQLKPMKGMQLDPLLLIAARFGLAEIYHKSQLVLHRRFLAIGRTNTRYVHSRRQCLESGLTLLSYQDILHKEARPQGRMQTMQWHLQSMRANDFLLAATILCMDLHDGLQKPDTSPGGSACSWGMPSKDDIVRALTNARNIWRELQDESMSAYKAAELLTMMIEKDRRESGSQTSSNTSAPVNGFSIDTSDEKQNAAITLGLLSSGAMTPNTASVASGQQQQTSQTANASGTIPATQSDQNVNLINMDMFGNPMDFGGSGGAPNMNLDWDSWDSYMAAFNQQQLPFAYDPANNLWGGNAPSPGNPLSSPGQLNPSSAFNSVSMAMNPASPGSLGAILNSELLYPPSANTSTSGPADTPQSANTNSNETSPAGQQQSHSGGNSATRDSAGYTSGGPFMGNPESNAMGNTGRTPAWPSWTTGR